MKIKPIRICLLLLIALFAALLLCSCNKVVVVSGIHMKDDAVIEMVTGEFSYDGKVVVVEYANGEKNEVNLTEEMIPEAERLKFFKMGEQEVKVVYSGRFVTTMKIKVLRHSFDDIYELVGYTCTYDGTPHRVELNHELPEGAVADYIYGNTFTNAGTYNIVAVLTKEGYVSKTLSTQLVIEKATYDTTELEFSSKTFTYDTEAKTLQAENVPDGVNVRYDVYSGNIRITNAVNTGTYRVVAHFDNTNSNYNSIPDRQATLTIQKADYDMSQVFLNNVTKTYDGINYTPTLDSSSVLPSGVSVSFVCKDKDGNVVTSNANAGEYDIIAHFASNSANHNPIPDMSAKLVVKKRVIEFGDDILFDDRTYNYDRQVHSLAVVGTIPDGVNVSYENNDQSNVGVYEVKAKFEAVNPNETVDVEELTSYLTINQIIKSVLINGHTISEADLRYDSSTYTISLFGLDTDIYYIKSISFYYIDDNDQQVRVVWGDAEYELIDKKTYNYSISFGFNDEQDDENITLLPSTGTFTYVDIVFDNKVVDYDGSPHTLQAYNVPSTYNYYYSYYLKGELVSQAVNAGEYEVVLHVLDGESLVFNKTAYLLIKKLTIDLSAVEFNSDELSYNGSQHTLEVTASTLPAGVSVTYEYKLNGVVVDSAINAGTYLVTAHFAPVDSVNHEINVQEKSANLVINKCVIDVSGVEFNGATVEYDGQRHYIYVTESTLPEGVTVEYLYYGVGIGLMIPINALGYTVHARFTPVDKNNYAVSEAEKIARLIISKATFTGEGITFSDLTIDYDRNYHSIYIVGNVPEGVLVSYTNNNKKYAGEYTVTVHFEAGNSKNVNVTAPDMQATLKINKIEEIVTSNGEPVTVDHFHYDPNTGYFTIDGIDSTRYTYDVYMTVPYGTSAYSLTLYPDKYPYEGNKLVFMNGNTYHYYVRFYSTDTDEFPNSVTFNHPEGDFTYQPGMLD